MGGRALAAFVVLGVVLADATGDHRAAFYLLVAAIPPLAIAAMDAFGEYLDGGSGFRSLAWAVALGLAVASSAVRGQVPGETSESRSRFEAAATSSTARSKAASFTRDGFVKPLILRTY